MNPQVDCTQVILSSLMNQPLSMKPRMINRPAVIYYLAAKIAGQSPVEPSAGFAKAAKMRIRSSVSIKRASCRRVRPFSP
jgi:hypothetical protein